MRCACNKPSQRQSNDATKRQSNEATKQSSHQASNKPRSSGNMYSVVCMWIYDRVGQGVNILQEQNILQFFNKWSRHNAMGQQHGPWSSKLWAILVHKETVNNKSTRSRRIAIKKKLLIRSITMTNHCAPIFPRTPPASGCIQGRNRCALIYAFRLTP